MIEKESSNPHPHTTRGIILCRPTLPQLSFYLDTNLSIYQTHSSALPTTLASWLYLPSIDIAAEEHTPLAQAKPQLPPRRQDAEHPRKAEAQALHARQERYLTSTLFPTPPTNRPPLLVDNGNHDDDAEFDEETTGHLHNEIEKAEQEGHPQGRPGSFLNRLISSGNKKTEDELMRDAQRMKEEDKARAAAGGAGPTEST